jgi:predicted DNA-binding antitoxin AbrB/MazE fold protein
MRVEPMREVTGIVENGRIKLPESVHLPDGARVRVILEEPTAPFEKEPLDDAEVEADLAWADGKRFS